jgi:penicillin-binding protein 1A
MTGRARLRHAPPAPAIEAGSEGPVLFRIVIVAPFALALVAVAAIGVLFIYYTIVFPDPLSLRPKDHASLVRVLDRSGAVLAERGSARDYVPLDLLPRHVTGAVVATEDRRFFEHWGLDPVGLVRAMFANLRAGRVAQGGSTVTQQLAKNLFLSSDRTMARKVEEIVLALWLDIRLSKRDILELYLTRVYFGGGA